MLQQRAIDSPRRQYLPGVQRLNGADDPPISPGHDRSLRPAQTVAGLKPYFPALGITRLGDLTGLDRLGIPVAFASRPNSFSLSVSLGKGVDGESAFASAAMEAAETAIAERLPDEHIHTSINELLAKGETIVDLARLARCHPQRLEVDTAIDWVEGTDLVSGQSVWVPWGLVGLDHRLALSRHHDAFEISTDGLASGNTAAEAVLHGIYELIERDAHALLELMPQNLLRQRFCDAGFLGNERLQDLQKSIRQANLTLRLIDMTTDLQVPAYMALISPSHAVENDASTPTFCAGCGCHMNSQWAVIRALTEASQARLALLAGARDDFQAKHYRVIEGTPRTLPWQDLVPARCQALSPTRSKALPKRPTFAESIETLLTNLVAAGIEQVIVVELKSKIPGISVVRVVTPDLQIPLHGTRTQITCRGLAQLVRFEQ